MKATQSLLATALLAIAFGTAVAAEVPTFAKADANGDGSIDATEFEAATAAGVEKTFAEVDKDGSGSLDKKEYTAILGEDCE